MGIKAKIGLDMIHIAEITETPGTGEETYSTPEAVPGAMTAELSVEIAEALMYTDDKLAVAIKEFKSGKIGLGIADLGIELAAKLTGASVDEKGVLVSASEDSGKLYAVGYRSKLSSGGYRYMWLYKVKFGLPSETSETKGDAINFQNSTIEGTVMARNKPDGRGKHPWQTKVDSDSTTIDAETITSWFKSVYEPTFATTGG